MDKQVKIEIAVIGGDLRQVHLAGRLAQAGFGVHALCLERDVDLGAGVTVQQDAQAVLSTCDVVILPLPVTVDGLTVNAPFSDQKLPLETVLRGVKKNTLLLGGMVSKELHTAGERLGITLVDYLEREELSVLNAVATAEGAIEIAMRELPITIFGSTCLVTGFGKISKTLTRLLHSMGARVVVAARKHSDLAWVKVCGYEGIHISNIKSYAGKLDLLVNTVPAMILDEENLASLNRGCLVIDLASKPGGIDFEMAKKLQIKTIWALSLPGRVAPISSGEIIKDTVINIMTERGLLE